MKKIILIASITFLIAATLVRADIVNMNISVNGTSNLNIIVDADDTLARQMISQTQSELNGTQNDVYGNLTGSGPKDVILNEIIRGYGNPINGTGSISNIDEICNNPSLQQWFSQISALPPIEFVNYLKALGYDDESHITLIWSMCQQKYVNQHQDQWSADTGIQSAGDIANIFEDVVNYLITGHQAIYSGTQRIAIALDSYFANKRDVWILSNQVNQLNLRVAALEKTMDNIAPEAYCQGKLDVMREYNLTGVKCGVNSTIYWNAKKAGFENYDIIAYTTCTEDWICSSWTTCVNGLETRKCVDKNKCGNYISKPIEIRECPVTQQQSIAALPPEKINTQELKTESKYPSLTKISELAFLVSVGFFIFVVFSIIIEAKKYPKKGYKR